MARPGRPPHEIALGRQADAECGEGQLRQPQCQPLCITANTRPVPRHHWLSEPPHHYGNEFAATNRFGTPATLEDKVSGWLNVHSDSHRISTPVGASQIRADDRHLFPRRRNFLYKDSVRCPGSYPDDSWFAIPRDRLPGAPPPRVPSPPPSARGLAPDGDVKLFAFLPALF